MQQAYGSPSDQEIENYLGELVTLLSDGYLDTVMYGFKKDGAWLPATLRYTALSLGPTGDGDRSGTVKRGVETAGAYFTSYLTYSQKWRNLSEETRARYKTGLPIQRVSGEEPKAPGGWIEDKTYISGGGGVRAPSASSPPPTSCRRTGCASGGRSARSRRGAGAPAPSSGPTRAWRRPRGAC